jgi:hypothetical protein
VDHFGLAGNFKMYRYQDRVSCEEDSFMTSPVDKHFIIRWTVLAIPYWLVLSFFSVGAVASAKLAFARKPGRGFSPTLITRR